MSISSSAAETVGSPAFRQSAEQPAEVPTFALWTGQRGLVCTGQRESLAPRDAESLGQRVREFFSRHRDGPPILVGALPFDRRRPVGLFQPLSVARRDARAPIDSQAHHPAYRWRLIGGGDPAVYAQAVARALRMIADSSATNSPLHKVVLARSLALQADRPIDVVRVVQHLARDKSVAAFIVRLPPDPAWRTDEHCLVGATPELLVAKSGSSVRSKPLAGSARRGRSPREDHAAARELIGSEKDRREHRAVVEAVLDALAPHCTQLSAGSGPALTSTDTMWHLGTDIEGTLKDPATPSVELAAALHPTPAVCGFPRERARATIEALEDFDRGFYAGAVGWTDSAGDGEWYVSIRCAEIAGARVRLFAGAGIVEGSDPATETNETAAKFAAVLEALGIDESTLAGVLTSAHERAPPVEGTS